MTAIPPQELHYRCKNPVSNSLLFVGLRHTHPLSCLCQSSCVSGREYGIRCRMRYNLYTGHLSWQHHNEPTITSQHNHARRCLLALMVDTHLTCVTCLMQVVMVSNGSHKPRYRGSGVVAGNLNLVPRMLWTLVAYLMGKSRISPLRHSLYFGVLSIAWSRVTHLRKLG